MKKYFLLVFIFIIVVVIIMIFTKKGDVKYDSTLRNLDFNMLNFVDIEIQDVKIKRYNEKLNHPKIKTLLLNLHMINTNDNNIDGYIKYAIIYSRTMDYNYEYNAALSDGVYLINKQYLNNWLEKLFMTDIYDNASTFKEENGIIKVKETDLEETTDTIDFAFDSMKYNANYDIYKVNIIKCDDNGNSYGDIEIIYRKNNSYITILNCKESSIYD